jgi:hypothetical protein
MFAGGLAELLDLISGLVELAAACVGLAAAVAVRRQVRDALQRRDKRPAQDLGDSNPRIRGQEFPSGQ